jgi:hypothetical protein
VKARQVAAAALALGAATSPCWPAVAAGTLGATDQEITKPLPGDDPIPAAKLDE